MEVMYTNPNTGVNIEMGLPQEGDLDPAIAEMISRAVASENMKPVTPEDIIKTSAAAFVATIDRGNGREVAGFLRQLEQPYVIPTRKKVLCLYELGTLLVNPEHRGRELAVADTMVRYGSWLMSRADRMARQECGDDSIAGYVCHTFQLPSVIPMEGKCLSESITKPSATCRTVILIKSGMLRSVHQASGAVTRS